MSGFKVVIGIVVGRKRNTWSTMTPAQKRMQVILMSLLGFTFIVGIVVFMIVAG